MEERIEQLVARFAEVEALLANPEVLSDQKRYRELAQEHSYLNKIKEASESYKHVLHSIAEDKKLLKEETDQELIDLIREEVTKLEEQVIVLRSQIENLLVPPDPNDSRNTIMEIRAGTGGDEAALFVGDMVRMYQLFATKSGWKFELLSCSDSEMGGFKEYIMVLTGNNVHRMLQYEAGTHRVQRVPDTETQGRVHTSTVTVAVLMEPDPEEKIDLDEKELKIDTYRASGAGGQHVNTTDSAVRITHLPTGAVVYCQQERSQHKNKEKAMRLLVAKIAEEKRSKLQKERAELRQSQVGTGERSERIRTYNYAQNRVSDHRITLTLHKLDQIMNGDLGEIVEALVSYFHQEKLKAK